MDTQFPPELSALIRLSNRQIPPGQIDQVRHALTGPFNWKSFMDNIMFHRTCAPVYRNITTHFSNEIPAEILQKLKSQNIRRMAQGLKQTREIISLSAVFKSKGIPVLFYKGVCLSQLLYNDPVERLSGDIDLMISPGALKNVEKVLFSMGYKRIDPQWGFDEANFKTYKDFHIHAIYISPNNVIVEVHWRLCFLKELCPVSFESLWQKKQYVSINGSDIPTLDNLHTAMVLFIHGTDHGWQRLFWLNDIAAFFENSPFVDPQLLADTTRKNRIERFLDQAFFLLNQWYGLTPPQGLPPHHDQRIKLSSKIIYTLYRSKPRPVIILLVEAQRLILYGWYYGFLYTNARLIAKYTKKRMAIDEKSEFLLSLKKCFNR